MVEFTVENIRKAARSIAIHVEKIADDLNTADGKLGDGDLGITVLNGWREVSKNADSFPDDVGLAFLECSKSFQRVSSSSFGTLIATAFMSAAKNCKGELAVPYTAVSMLLYDACAAMISRGKGQLGDKTVLDIFHSMAAAAEGHGQPVELLVSVRKAVENTMAEFNGKQNRIGRARMFGKNSIGLDDPGMLAIREMVNAIS